MAPSAAIASSSAAPAELEAERHLSLLAAGLDRRRQAAEQAGIAALPEGDAVAGLQPLGRARQSLPAVGPSRSINVTAICAVAPSRSREPRMPCSRHSSSSFSLLVGNDDRSFGRTVVCKFVGDFLS